MPTITAYGQTFSCTAGANLRQVLLQHDIPVHNGNAIIINCRGLGSCGTCAVQVSGAVSEANWRDRTRRALPPHNPGQGRRLACQTRVLGGVTVQKFDGFWGQGEQQLW